MNRKLTRLVIAALYFFPLFGHAQMVDSMMKVYSEKFPQEKLYVQFDKKAYNPGDRIWYKAYLFSGFDPSPYSKNFYAELYDAAGNLILRSTAPINESTAIGNFDIPASFSGTRIRVRAYTTWMLNFDSIFIFTKDLRIIALSEDTVSHPDPTPTIIHFFPEGGDLVAGVENNIAFKANDAFGQPRKITGILFDQSGKELLSFSSTHDGMGKFLLQPDKDEVFNIVWKDETGIEHKSDLPAVKASGISLRILNTDDKLIFSVARAADNPSYKKVVVIAHVNQQMIYKAIVNLTDVLISGGNIPTGQLPTGIVQVTVFDMNEMPLAERVCFVNNHNYSFDVGINVVRKSLQRRGRNEMNIELPNNMKSNVCVAITDAEVDGNRQWDDNIITSLLLTGDLHGYVKDPYYYFMNNADTLRQQLDLVMLTHGWRRFKWQDLARGKVPMIKYPLDNFLSINAEVLGIDKSRIAKDESLNIIFQNKDSSSHMLTASQVSAGKFQVTGMVYYDTAKAYYQFNADHKLSDEAAVIIRNGLYPGVRKLRPFDMTMATWSADDSSLVRKNREVFDQIAIIHKQDKRTQSLAAVTVRARVKSDKEKLDELYSSGLFSGGNATIFDIEDDKTAFGSLNIFNYLQSRVAGLEINTSGNIPTLTWRGSSPTLYLNEMKIDASQLKSISIADIAMVKIFSPGEGIGLDGSGGTISVYTKKGKDAVNNSDFKGLDMVRLIGYSPIREFYSPDYLINPEPENDDSRTTLYWNPNLKGSKGQSKFNIPFYNSDVTHRIRVILEGYDEDGKLVHAEKIIE
jgi:hypothetical protein